MNRDATAGAGWLDSLARWTVRGEAAPSPVAAIAPAGGRQGVSRRTVLRTAAGAALVAGPLRFLIPAAARADYASLVACKAAANKKADDAFQACVKDPLEVFDAAQSTIASQEGYLADQRKPSARRRLKRNIARAKRDGDRAIRQIEDCNVKWFFDRANGEVDCQTANPPVVKSPVGAGNNGGPPGAPGGCDTGYLLCGDYCCNLAYATCVGCNGTPICCRIGGNCCGGG